jgi:hypothetical protein
MEIGRREVKIKTKAFIGGIMPLMNDSAGIKKGAFSGLANMLIDFVLIKVDLEPIESFLDRLDNLIGLVIANGATVETIMSCLVVATYGATKDHPASEEKRRMLVRQLTSKLKDPVAVVHGRRFAWVGIYGSSRRITYGSIIPDMLQYLTILDNLVFGESAAI